MPTPKRPVDVGQLYALRDQGLSLRQIAQQTGHSYGVVQQCLAQRGQPTSTAVDALPAPIAKAAPGLALQEGLPQVDVSLPPSEMMELQSLLPILWEVAREWAERQAFLQVHPEQPRSTVRWTYHLDARWVEAVKQYANVHRLSMSAVVNMALQRFFSSQAFSVDGGLPS